MSGPNDFMLVGARFSRIIIDEHALFSAETDEFSMEIRVQKAKISDQTFGDRTVIELVVGARAVGVSGDEHPALADDVFVLECVGGFVGSDPAYDGDLKQFDASAPFFRRALYWMLRERMQSIASVTLLRQTDDLPWDLDTAVASLDAGKALSSKKKTTKKEKTPQ